MERILEKMANQLNAYDEASLMHLWNKYAVRVSEFEPTKKWEEAVLCLGLIQMMHWKNQLFNFHMADQAGSDALPPLPAPTLPDFSVKNKKSGSAQSSDRSMKKATILRFPKPPAS